MALPKGFIDELRARVPLSELIGKRMKLVRAGREYKGCCPFHNEKTPSFYVNNDKGFYHCFGCGAHGDAIGFLQQLDNLRFMEAVEALAAQAGMVVPKPSAAEEKKFARQMSLYDLMGAADKWYRDQLHKPENKKILQYLLERGLSLETIKTFGVGYAPSEDQNNLGAYLKKEGFKDEGLIDAGLFRKSEKRKGEIYPFFRQRVMFPVLDFRGRVVAFGGRVLPETHGGPSGKGAPKYINSPESAIFHKGSNLYGLSRARKAIGEDETVIVVEGYMDVIALYQAGFRGAVAPLGTALTESQILALWKVMPEGRKTPVLCFDGDTAGQRAALRAMERVLPVLKPDHTVRFAFLPEGHDPDSLIKAEGRSAMEKVLSNAASLFDMLWQEQAATRDLSQPEARAGLWSALMDRARAISDAAMQEFFVHEIKQRVRDVFLTLAPQKKAPYRRGYNKQPEHGAHAAYRPMQGKVKPLKSKKFMREKILIAAMIQYPELYDEFSEEFGLLRCDSLDCDQVRHSLISLLDQRNDLDYQAVKTHLVESGQGRILDDLFEPSLFLHAGFVKPDQPYDDVRQGWEDVYTRGQSLPKARQQG
ncbi:MAG: DNA primase [Alphaproteobacteria bacterium]|nr:DNA primase [Alphaproteobacteria bacterium]